MARTWLEGTTGAVPAGLYLPKRAQLVTPHQPLRFHDRRTALPETMRFSNGAAVSNATASLSCPAHPTAPNPTGREEAHHIHPSPHPLLAPGTRCQTRLTVAQSLTRGSHPPREDGPLWRVHGKWDTGHLQTQKPGLDRKSCWLMAADSQSAAAAAPAQHSSASSRPATLLWSLLALRNMQVAPARGSGLEPHGSTPVLEGL